MLVGDKMSEITLILITCLMFLVEGLMILPILIAIPAEEDVAIRALSVYWILHVLVVSAFIGKILNLY